MSGDWLVCVFCASLARFRTKWLVFLHLSAEKLTILCGIEPKTRKKRIPASRPTSVRAAPLSKDLTAAAGPSRKVRFRRALGPRERVCCLTHLRLSPCLGERLSAPLAQRRARSSLSLDCTPLERNRDDEARRSEVQDRSPHGREHLGPPPQPL